MLIDARGKNCPIPVLLTKKEIDAGATELTVLVDNAVAVENVKRLAAANQFVVAVTGEAPEFRLSLQRAAASDEAVCTAAERPAWALFAGRDVIGAGERELGEALMKSFFFTLRESDDPPRYLLLMNSGVRLAVENEQVIEHLRQLAEQGTEILVCGTCLNYYGLTERLQVGTVSNMYDILGRMQAAAKVISL